MVACRLSRGRETLRELSLARNCHADEFIGLTRLNQESSGEDDVLAHRQVLHDCWWNRSRFSMANLSGLD